MTLDAETNQAIREEIAERLRALLARNQSPPPERLSALVERLRELDHRAPSIVPDRSPAPIQRRQQKWRAVGKWGW
jgi:hypothetical protein